MKILRTNCDTANKKELYRLTKAASVRVQDADAGTPIPVGLWAYYEEEKEDVSVRPVLAIVTADGRKLATISSTFIRSFLEIVDLMEDEAFAIVIIHGTSKGGRGYVDCELYCGE